MALILRSGLGCEPIGLLCDGISRFFSVQFGIGSLIYNLLVIGAALLVAKENLGMGTVVYGLLSGFFIDLYQLIVVWILPQEMDTVGSALLFVIGELSMATAFAILMRLHLGMTALDALLVRGQKRMKIPYALLKSGVDVLFVTVGTILGGTFGIGTILSALFTGMFVSKIADAIEKLQMKVSKRERCVVR